MLKNDAARWIVRLLELLAVLPVAAAACWPATTRADEPPLRDEIEEIGRAHV